MRSDGYSRHLESGRTARAGRGLAPACDAASASTFEGGYRRPSASRHDVPQKLWRTPTAKTWGLSPTPAPTALPLMGARVGSRRDESDLGALCAAVPGAFVREADAAVPDLPGAGSVVGVARQRGECCPEIIINL